MRSQGKCAQLVFDQARSLQALLTGADRGSLGPPGQPPGPIRLRARCRCAAAPAGGSVRAWMEPPPRRAQTQPIKTRLFGLRTAFVKRALSRGIVRPTGLLKGSAKHRCCSASACSEMRRKPSQRRGKKRQKKKKKKSICVLFIYSEPCNLPIILYITQCLGKSCSETIFVTRENQACALVPLGESMKRFFPYEIQHA